MTKETKLKMEELKNAGLGYKRIAAELNLPLGTVTSYFTRQKKNPMGYCKCCGAKYKLRTGNRPKIFCSDDCRMKWWNNHPEQRTLKAYYTLTCQYCGETFVAYGNKHRKYCSRHCYYSAKQKGSRYE